ncbi:MAG TPA: PDZ domain-containing protein [Pyrinomonadaceae bacterium]|nr:PDZ domain-containing protein [Pyrinomonadaceae bacterium]
MKIKYLLSLLAIIVLSGGLVWAQQTPSPPPAESGDVFTLFNDAGGYLGVYAENISRDNMSRYNMNQVRGVGVTQVIKDSPAEKAGLKKDDVILRVAGETVTSVRKLNRVVSEIAPDQSVKVTVSRGGSEQELTATLGRKSTSFQTLSGDDPKIWKFEGPFNNFKDWKWEDFQGDGDGPRVFSLGARRRIGVSTVALTKQLAAYFGIADGKGVLVTSVDGPAAAAGVKAGDVITAVDGEKVETSGDVSRIINGKKDGPVTLTIVRNKSQQTIQVTPADKNSSDDLRPQLGRQIVIPRIVFPTIPDVNVSLPAIRVALPRIEIPVMPTINVEMPQIKVAPRVRVIRGARQPI